MRAVRSLLFVLSLAFPATAAPTEAEINAARKLFEQAQEHEASGRWIDALDLLQRILLVKETAGVRFHAALCREHLGQLTAAEADYRRAAELATQMKSKEGTVIVDQTSSALAALKPRIPLLTVKVPPGVRGLKVELNGASLSPEQLGQPLPRDPGALPLRATAPGYETFERTVALTERNNQTVEITLVPEKKADAPASPPALSSSPPAETAAPPTASAARWPVYVAGGLGLAAAGGGIYFYLQHQRLSNETDDICNNPEYQCDRSGRNARLSDYKTYGLVSGGAALVGLGLATYFYVTASPKKSNTALMVGPGSVQLVGRW